MADSPFVSDDEALAYGGQPDVAPAAPDLNKQRLTAALQAAAALSMFLPMGKVLGAAGGPLKRAALGAGLGAGVGLLSDAGSAQESFPSSMHELQSRLKKAGIYDAPVDGISKPGGPTEKAVERLHKMFGEGDPIHLLRMMQDPAYKASEEARKAEEAKAGAEKTKSELGLAETKRRNDLDAQVAKAASEGETWAGWAKAKAPYLIGAGIGGALGLLPGYKFNKAALTKATDAETLAKNAFIRRSGATRSVLPGTAADRAGAVNTFWERGGAPAPFTKMATSGEVSPKSNVFQVADQTPAGDLYKISKPARAGHLGLDALALGAAGADYFGTSMAADKNKNEADEARKRFSATQSAQDAVEATHAQGRANLWSAATNAAMPAAVAYLTARKLMPRKIIQPDMKSMAAADSMRLKVQDYLNRQPAGGPQSVLAGKGGAPAPLYGGQLQAIPAPAAGQGIAAQAAVGRAAAAERRANTEKIMGGSMAQRTQQLMQEHVNTFAKAVQEGPNLGKPLLTTRRINELQRILESEHGIPISNWKLRKILKEAGVILG